MSRRMVTAAIAATILGTAPVAAQNFALAPTFGQVTLNAGFTPDPHTVDIVAGGGIDAFDAIGTDFHGNTCVGMIADAPDYRVNYTAGSWPLIFSVMASEDTTLVINAPDGQWYCDDDGAGYPNPMIEFATPMSGQYDIWVGDYLGGNAEATLTITELGGTAGPAPAGGMPDFGLPPTFGEANLTAGFTPDPYTVNLVAGGDISAATADPSCYGFVAAAPDFRLHYTAGGWPLIFSVVASEDTTLVVNAPDGQWYCDDDGAGFPNPEIVFDTPMSGQYDIWIGTFSGGTADATLIITEIGGGGAGPTPPPPSPGAGGGMPDFTLLPTFGEATLNAGFAPDPYSVLVDAGGNISAYDALGSNCYGSIAAAPDFRLHYQAGSWPLIFNVLSDSDTTLVVNAPDGQWYCDDDSAGNLNPEVVFDTPMSGQYDIWVGTFGGGVAAATLNITELGGGAGQPGPGAGGMPDFTLPATFGTAALNAGFTPDPYTVSLTAGGDINAFDALGGNCRGDIATAPDFSLDYQAGNWMLYIWAIADMDTTIVINGPDGQWYCDDDSGGNLNPLFEFAAPLSGRYDIWVGTYNGGTAPATLYISELGP